MVFGCVATPAICTMPAPSMHMHNRNSCYLGRQTKPAACVGMLERCLETVSGQGRTSNRRLLARCFTAAATTSARGPGAVYASLGAESERTAQSRLQEECDFQTSCQVFICHRGPDTKHNIADALYHELTTKHGLKVFLDARNLPATAGADTPAAIQQALRSAPVGVAILSSTFFDSKDCASELRDMLDARDRKQGFVFLPLFFQIKVNKLSVKTLTSRKRQKWYDQAESRIKKEDLASYITRVKGIVGKEYNPEMWNTEEIPPFALHLRRLLPDDPHICLDSILPNWLDQLQRQRKMLSSPESSQGRIVGLLYEHSKEQLDLMIQSLEGLKQRSEDIKSSMRHISRSGANGQDLSVLSSMECLEIACRAIVWVAWGCDIACVAALVLPAVIHGHQRERPNESVDNVLNKLTLTRPLANKLRDAMQDWTYPRVLGGAVRGILSSRINTRVQELYIDLANAVIQANNHLGKPGLLPPFDRAAKDTAFKKGNTRLKEVLEAGLPTDQLQPRRAEWLQQWQDALLVGLLDEAALQTLAKTAVEEVWRGSWKVVREPAERSKQYAAEEAGDLESAVITRDDQAEDAPNMLLGSAASQSNVAIAQSEDNNADGPVDTPSTGKPVAHETQASWSVLVEDDQNKQQRRIVIEVPEVGALPDGLVRDLCANMKREMKAKSVSGYPGSLLVFVDMETPASESLERLVEKVLRKPVAHETQASWSVLGEDTPNRQQRRIVIDAPEVGELPDGLMLALRAHIIGQMKAKSVSGYPGSLLVFIDVETPASESLDQLVEKVLECWHQAVESAWQTVVRSVMRKYMPQDFKQDLNLMQRYTVQLGAERFVIVDEGGVFCQILTLEDQPRLAGQIAVSVEYDDDVCDGIKITKAAVCWGANSTGSFAPTLYYRLHAERKLVQLEQRLEPSDGMGPATLKWKTTLPAEALRLDAFLEATRDQLWGNAISLSDVLASVHAPEDGRAASGVGSLSTATFKLQCFVTVAGTLRLSCKFSGTVPAIVWEQTELRELWLDGNGLEELPSGVGNLSKLEKLVLSNNNLKSIPRELGNLKELRVLLLDGNKLTHVAGIETLTALEELALQKNKFAKLPIEVCMLQDLQRLNLRCNYLKALPLAIKALSKLRVLNLDDNRLRALPKEIQHLTELQELSVLRNKLNHWQFPEVVVTLLRLKKLQLDGIFNARFNIFWEGLDRRLQQCQIANKLQDSDGTAAAASTSAPETGKELANSSSANQFEGQSVPRGR
eukprot:jgi/Chlat1/3545/Chrsp231S03545